MLSTIMANYQQPTTEQAEKIKQEFFNIVWLKAMEAKEAANAVMPNIREELLENLCSSAPSVYFTTHADLSDSLTQAENTSASVFVSTDNQNSWTENSNVNPLNEEGYETTWGATTTTDGGSIQESGRVEYTQARVGILLKMTDENTGLLVWSHSYWYSGIELPRTAQVCAKNSIGQLNQLLEKNK